MGAWDGDEVEGPEETRAASMAWGIPGEHGTDDEGRHPVLSSVLSGEKIQVRPRCDDCGSVMLRDDHGASWCASCITGEVEGDGLEKTAIPMPADGVMREFTLNGSMDARGLAALPVTLRPEILEYHQAVVKQMFREEVGEWEMELGFNPQTGAFDAMMDGKVMQMLREMGPGVKIKGKF
jgi:hypothetical protein